MLIRVETDSGTPLHAQIAGQMRRAIASGDPAPGQKLPAARTLAEGLGVNVHTLLRAFQSLRDEGLLEVRRGRGTIVTGAAPPLARLNALAQDLVAEARRSGMADMEIRRLLEVQL